MNNIDRFKLFFLSIMVLFSVKVKAQCGIEEDEVKEIRKKYQIINSKKKDYKLLTTSVNDPASEEDDSNRSSFDSVFIDNNQVRLIKVFKSGSYWTSNNTLTEYYFWDDQAFFIYKRHITITYNQDDCAFSSKCPAKGREDRFYYCDMLCWRHLTKEIAGTAETIYSDLVKAKNEKMSCYEIKSNMAREAEAVKIELLEKYNTEISR